MFLNINEVLKAAELMSNSHETLMQNWNPRAITLHNSLWFSRSRPALSAHMRHCSLGINISNWGEHRLWIQRH